MASLLSTGRQIKGSAMAGLTAAARDEASQQIAEEQLERAKDAQQASLVGTGLGIGGAAAIMSGGTAAATTAGAGTLATKTAAQQLATTVPQALGIAAPTSTAATVGGGTAGASSAGAAGAAGVLANPVTWAVIAGLYLLKKVF